MNNGWEDLPPSKALLVSRLSDLGSTSAPALMVTLDLPFRKKFPTSEVGVTLWGTRCLPVQGILITSVAR